MRVHFISIGGSVMHQLAIALQKMGYTVSGSDDEIFEPSLSVLNDHQLLPRKFGWFEENITPDLDAVLLGMHARADNPELLKAQALQLPIYSFPEYIYHESRDKTRVVVGGSHGKTTTTSMMMHVLQYAGSSFDYLVGARLPGFDSSVQISHAPVIVCEGDEYPASALEKRPKFHFLHPQIAILTGIAWDHINVFPTFENYLEQFRIFLSKIEKGGTLIYNETDEILHKLVGEYPSNHFNPIGYGLPSFRKEGDHTILMLGGHEAVLKVFGNHNLLNLHAAWLACRELGIGEKTFCEAIANFTGASKRLEVLAQNEERIVFRDFAHAPSKVKATMDAVKNQYPQRKVAAVLELHTYSSLNKDFMPHYRGALDAADAACVFYSPHAMEIKKMPSLPASIVADGFSKEGLSVITESKALEEWIEAHTKDCDNLLLMSSGSYDGMDLKKIAQDWID
jgi:UDP-N-acetylmuramate: L-alanyl-gamma-D-glutamyl-meso-diaminopimelate ligase